MAFLKPRWQNGLTLHHQRFGPVKIPKAISHHISRLFIPWIASFPGRVCTKLQQSGWATLTIWECEIGDIVAVEMRLVSFLDDCECGGVY